MTQRHHGHSLNAVSVSPRSSFECGERPRRSSNRQLSSMAIDFQRNTQLGNRHQQPPIDLNARKKFLSPCDLFAKLILGGCELGFKCGGIIIESLASFDYLYSLIEVGDRRDLRVQSEAIQKLRSQFALLRISRTHEHESRGVTDRDSLALNDIPARSC